MFALVFSASGTVIPTVRGVVELFQIHMGTTNVGATTSSVSRGTTGFPTQAFPPAQIVNGNAPLVDYLAYRDLATVTDPANDVIIPVGQKFGPNEPVNVTLGAGSWAILYFR